jgi:hypothetical protein
MIAFTVTIITFYFQTKGLGIDTLHHTIEYYEMLVDRMEMQNEVDKARLISKYADIIISVFTGLVAVVFTPIFKTIGEFIGGKTKALLELKFKNLKTKFKRNGNKKMV